MCFYVGALLIPHKQEHSWQSKGHRTFDWANLLRVYHRLSSFTLGAL